MNALFPIMKSMHAMTVAAYNHVQMEYEDQQKAAFTTTFGLHEYTRMLFEVYNASATYQRVIQTAFQADMFNISSCQVPALCNPLHKAARLAPTHKRRKLQDKSGKSTTSLIEEILVSWS